MVQIVRNFFATDTFPQSLNKTLITLVPKASDPESFSQYRPISCCNFAYKVISKVLANRLKPWLLALISPQQTGFIQGRNIQENIIIAHEAIHALKVSKKGAKAQFAIKLDLAKAYDKVDWKFL